MRKRVYARVEEFTELRDRIRVLDKRLFESNARHENLKVRMNRYQDRFEKIDAHKAIVLLDKIEARVSRLSRKVQIELLKQCVATEVTRMFPDRWHDVVLALDKPDVWWRVGNEYSILEWSEYLQVRNAA